MITSKHLISQISSKMSNKIIRQDASLNISRKFSKTSVLERRINTRRPRPPHHERALVMDICKPKYVPDIKFSLPDSQKCIKTSVKQYWLEKEGANEENVLANIFAAEIRELFRESKMVAIFHQHSMLGEVLFDVRKSFKRIGMNLITYHGKDIIIPALKDTKYAPLMQLFQVNEALLFSPEIKVDVFLKVLKKTPQLSLMATIIDDRILSKTETEIYAATDLETQRALLVQTINSAATTLTSQLNQPQQSLVFALDQHASSDNATVVSDKVDSTDSS